MYYLSHQYPVLGRSPRILKIAAISSPMAGPRQPLVIAPWSAAEKVPRSVVAPIALTRTPPPHLPARRMVVGFP